jgi:hypothetical protein
MYNDDYKAWAHKKIASLDILRHAFLAGYELAESRADDINDKDREEFLKTIISKLSDNCVFEMYNSIKRSDDFTNDLKNPISKIRETVIRYLYVGNTGDL